MIKTLSCEKNYSEKTVLGVFFADSKSDVTNTFDTTIIPDGWNIATGSKCTVADGTVYRYKSNKTWVESSSGGGGGGDDRAATEEEVDETIDGIVKDLHL